MLWNLGADQKHQLYVCSDIWAPIKSTTTLRLLWYLTKSSNEFTFDMTLTSSRDDFSFACHLRVYQKQQWLWPEAETTLRFTRTYEGWSKSVTTLRLLWHPRADKIQQIYVCSDIWPKAPPILRLLWHLTKSSNDFRFALTFEGWLKVATLYLLWPLTKISYDFTLALTFNVCSDTWVLTKSSNFMFPQPLWRNSCLLWARTNTATSLRLHRPLTKSRNDFTFVLTSER